MRVVEENERLGTEAWWEVEHAPAGSIEGYTTQCSAQPGGQIELCVSTNPAARYEVIVYRLGWYGGAGGREMGRLASNMGLARVAPYPDAETGIVRAGWPVTDIVPVAPDAVSGQYVAHLRLLGGPHRGKTALVGFVVRPAPGDGPSVLVQTPVNTLQAYNHWGGRSLYISNSNDGIAGVKVSFDRPVPPWSEANLNSRAPFVYDVPLLRWMEREGLDVGYQTDVDTHRAPWTLVGPRVVATSGHDEYWSREMRDAIDDARDRGVSLAFFGANTGYWQIRYEDDERTIVEYRSAKLDPERDPASQTVKFRDLDPARDERRLLGVQFQGGQTSPTQHGDYAVDANGLRDRWAQGTGLDSLAPVTGVVGYEWDALDEAEPPPGLVRFLTHDGELSNASCVRWTAASGARIFSAGSLALPWALDDWAAPGRSDARVQRLVRNALADMLS